MIYWYTNIVYDINIYMYIYTMLMYI
jgi:hypothetical protein